MRRIRQQIFSLNNPFGNNILAACGAYTKDTIWRITNKIFFVQFSNTMHCTEKKENKIFLIYKEFQSGAVAKSYMTNGLLIWGNICAFPHILGSQLLHSGFPYIREKFDILFLSVQLLSCSLTRPSLNPHAPSPLELQKSVRFVGQRIFFCLPG